MGLRRESSRPEWGIAEARCNKGRLPLRSVVLSRRGTALNDPAIRSALRRRLQEDALGQDPSTVIIDELGLRRGRARLDVAVVNGLFHGYEIKSDRDSIRRLEGQVSVYGAVLDRVTLVVGDRFVKSAKNLVPSWWGLLHACERDTRIHFRVLRRARANQGRDPRALVELLWRDSTLDLLEQRNAARGLRRKPRPILWDHVCAHYSVDEIAAVVRANLKARSRN